MACNGYRFMVYRILSQAHLKEVGPTQNRKTMTLCNLIPLIYQNLLCRRVHMNGMVMTLHSAENSFVYVFTLQLKAVTTQDFISKFHSTAFG